MELEISDIRLQAKKRSKGGKDRETDIRGSKRSITGNSGSTLARQLEPQLNISVSVENLQRHMAKFKNDFLNREYLILELANNITTLEMVVRNGRRIENEFLSPRFESESKMVMQNRVHELQRLNNDLLNELRETNNKLMNARFDKSHPSSPVLEQNRPLKTVLSVLDQREYLKSSDLNLDIEKKRLNDRIQLLTKELEAAKRLQETKVIEAKAENDSKVNFYFKKLTDISHCLNQFIPALETFEDEIVTCDPYNLKLLIDNFDTEKHKLLNLSRDLRIYDQDTVRVARPIILSSIKGHRPSQFSSHAKIKTEFELSDESLSPRIASLSDNEVPLSNYHSERSSRVQLGRVSKHGLKSTNLNDILYINQSKQLQNNERVSELESLLRERNREIEELKRKPITNIYPDLISSIKNIDSEHSIRLNDINNLLATQTDRLRSLTAFIIKLAKNRLKELSKASTLIELEEKLISMKYSMQQKCQNLERENNALKQQIEQLKRHADEDVNLRENEEISTTRTTSKDLLLARNKAIIEELNKNLKKSRTQIRYLEKIVSENCSIKETGPKLSSLKNQLYYLLENYNNSTNEGLIDLDRRLDDAMLQLRRYQDNIAINEYYKKHKQDPMRFFEDIYGNMRNMFEQNNYQILDNIENQYARLEKLTSTVSRLNDAMKKSNEKARRLSIMDRELSQELVKEKKRLRSLDDAIYEKELQSREALQKFYEFVVLMTKSMCQDIANELQRRNQNRLASLIKLINKLKKHLDDKNKTEKELKNENDELRYLLAQKETELENLEHTTNEVDQQSKDIIDDLNKKLSQRDKIIQEMKKQKLEGDLQSKLLKSKSDEEIENLKDKQGDLNKAVDDINRENKKLQGSLEEKTKNIKQLKDKINNLTEQNKKQKDDLNKEMKLSQNLKNDIEELNKEIERLNKILGVNTAELEDLKKELDDKNREVKNIIKNKKEDEEHIAKLEDEKRDNDDIKEENEKQINDLNDQLNELKEKIENNINKINDKDEEINQLKSKINELNNKLKDENSNSKSKDKLIKELSLKYSNLNESLNDKDKDISKLEKLLKDAKKEGEKFKEIGTKLTDQGKSRDKLIEDLKAENTKLSEKLTEEGDDIQEKDKIIDNLHKEYDDKINQLNDQLLEEQEKVKKLQILKVDDETQCDEFTKVVDQKDEEIKEMSKLMNEIKENADEKLNDYNTKFKKEKDELEEDYKQQINELMDEIETFKDKLETKEEEITELRKKTDKVINDLEDENNKAISDLKKIIDDLKKEHDKNIEDLNKKHDKTIEEVKKKSDKNSEDAKKKNDKIIEEQKKKNDKVLDDLKKRNDKTIENLNKTIDDLKKDSNNAVKNLNNELKDSKKELDKAINDLKTKNKNIENLNKEHDKAIEDLRKKNDRIIADLNKEIENLKKENVKVRGNLDKVIEDLKNKNDYANNLNNEIDNLKKENEKAIDDLENTLNNLKNDINGLKKENDDLKNEGSNLNNELLKIHEENKDLNKRLLDNDDALNEKNNEIQDLAKKLENQANKDNKLIEDLKAENTKLSEKLTEEGDDIQEKDKIIDNLHKEYDDKINQLNDQLLEEKEKAKALKIAKIDTSSQCNLLLDELSGKDYEIKRLKDIIKSLTAKLEEKEDEIRQLTLQNEKLGIKLDMEKRKASLIDYEKGERRGSSDSSGSLEDLEKRVKELQDELARQANENNESMKKLIKKSAALELKNTELSKELTGQNREFKQIPSSAEEIDLDEIMLQSENIKRLIINCVETVPLK